MRNLKCPQCEVQRFYIKNGLNENRLVTVNEQLDVVPVNAAESLDGFDLTVVYCLGCSWQGSPKALLGGRHN